MRKFLISAIIFSTLLIGGVQVKADTVRDEILKGMNGLTMAELNQNIKDASSSLGISESDVEQQILSELKVQEKLSQEERAKINKRATSRAATYTLGAPKYNGDIFYEPASTFSVQHGHVGIYWTGDTIVESVPNPGVRSINRRDKQVETGSYIFTLSGVPVSTQNEASNWAYGEINEKYSYNFATNRLTGYGGDKNCSKLVWSAYQVKANLDIDADGGAGVYPKDILRYSKSSIYTVY